MDIESALPVFMEYSDVNHTISRGRSGSNETAADGAVVLRSVNLRDPGDSRPPPTVTTTAKKSLVSNTPVSNGHEKQQHRRHSRDSREIEAKHYGDTVPAPQTNGHQHGTTNGTTMNGHHNESSEQGSDDVGVHVWALYPYEVCCVLFSIRFVCLLLFIIRRKKTMN